MHESVFDIYALELITSHGVVQVYGAYVLRERAEEMAQFYYSHGWGDAKTGVRHKVYQVNIVEMVVFV